MATCGAIPVASLLVFLVVVATMLDDHHLVVVRPPTLMPSMITMLTEFSAGAHAIAITMLDDGCLGACNGRHRDSNGAQRGDDISKLLHVVLLIKTSRIKLGWRRNVPQEIQENSEQPFSNVPRE